MKQIQRGYTILVCFVTTSIFCQPIANYVLNGSFEEKFDCSGIKINKAIGWRSVDSISYGGAYLNICAGNVPKSGNTYQFPRTGDAYIINTWYNQSTLSGIGYMRNRLKSQLLPGTKYCVKFYVNLTNNSPRGIDSFGAYFGDQTIDTITKCNQPLVYLIPQVSNPTGNIISDSINWIPITGTFVASGNEKYLILGNFRSNSSVQTASINTAFFPGNWTDVCIDDVSCIEVNLNAYAGNDTAIAPGDSAFIGREPDFAVDPYCTWYQWPNLTTPIKITSGMWVKPVNTTTYSVKQELECGSTKWDTVVVYMNLVGLKENTRVLNVQSKLYPLPASDKLMLSIANAELGKEFKIVLIYNNLGELLKEEEIHFDENTARINIGDLPEGIYWLTAKSDKSGVVSKRFVIQR